MASITTQTVGAAAGALAASAVNVAREVVNIARPQIAKLTKAESDRVTISGTRYDSERSPAEPKQTEATYSKTATKKK